MFKNFDWKHWLAYIACILILGAVHGVDVLKPYAPVILTIALPLFLYAGISMQQAGFAATKGEAVDAAKKIVAFVLMLGLLAHTTACISSAPVVPVTPANASQVSSCQSTAALHNGVVVGDFILGGGTSALGGVGALVSDLQAKTDFAIAAAVLGGLTLAGTAIAGLTSSNFANSHCSDVVGPLPLGAKAHSK